MMGNIIILVVSIILLITVIIGVIEVIVTIHYQLSLERIGSELYHIAQMDVNLLNEETVKKKLLTNGLVMRKFSVNVINENLALKRCTISVEAESEYRPTVLSIIPTSFSLDKSFIVRRNSWN